MKSSEVAAKLERMAAQPGIDGCAIVDSDAGMIWLASARVRADDRLWEAAVDYWRLHQRQKSHFAPLGGLRAAVLYHDSRVLALFPCCSEPDLLLVAVGEHRGVDWGAWQRQVPDLAQVIRGSS